MRFQAVRNASRPYYLVIATAVVRLVCYGLTAAFVASAAHSVSEAQTQPVAPTDKNSAAMASSGYVPNRVYDTHKNAWIDFETLVARANQSQLVFVGEQHNNTPGHAMELALLEGIARRRLMSAPVVLSLEMFERDVQPQLNQYLAGDIDESAFLRNSRPWPNYGADYKPLIELAKLLRWPVIAADIPRPLASVVSHGGLQALDTIDRKIRAEQIAADISCPHDDYFKLFAAVMSDGGHGDAPHGAVVNADSVRAAATAAAAMTQRFYEAQCVKDETMGESIVRAFDVERTANSGGDNTLVVHMNGAFHTDYGLGTAQRAIQRAKGVKHMIVSIIPVPNLDDVDAKSMRKLADYLVFTIGKSED